MRFFHWGESTSNFFSFELQQFECRRPPYHSSQQTDLPSIQSQKITLSNSVSPFGRFFSKTFFSNRKKIITFLLKIKFFSWGSNIQSFSQSVIFCKQQQLKFSCGRKQSLTLGGAVDEWSKALNLREKIKKKKQISQVCPKAHVLSRFWNEIFAMLSINIVLYNNLKQFFEDRAWNFRNVFPL